MSAEVSTPGDPIRLLIVEDELPIVFALRGLFTDQGYHVDYVAGISEEERMLNRFPYSG